MHRCWRSLAGALDNAKVAAFVVVDFAWRSAALTATNSWPRECSSFLAELSAFRSITLYSASLPNGASWGSKILLFAVPPGHFGKAPGRLCCSKTFFTIAGPRSCRQIYSECGHLLDNHCSILSEITTFRTEMFSLRTSISTLRALPLVNASLAIEIQASLHLEPGFRSKIPGLRHLR